MALEDPALGEQGTGLGLDYGLMTRYTAFIAVERTMVNEGGAQRRVDVPVELPEGVSFGAVLGDRGVAGAGGGDAHRDRGARIRRREPATGDDDSVDDGAAASAGSYTTRAESIELTSLPAPLRARRWRFDLTVAFGSSEVDADDRAAVGLPAARATRAVTGRGGPGAPLSPSLPPGRGRPWPPAPPAPPGVAAERLALRAGLGGAIDSDGAPGLGYHAAAQLRLLRIGSIELDLELRLDGAALAGDAANPTSLSGGVTLGF